MKPTSLGKSTAEARAVYDKMIEVFFFFAPIEGFDELVYPDFLGYGTAAHEFFKDREAVKQMAKLQAEQLRETKFTLTRKPVDEKFLSNGSVYLILEDFELYMEDNDQVVPLRLSTILEKISGKWMVTHFHGSTPDANIDEEEALPMEGLRKKNEELEEKIRERTRELEIEASLERVRARAMAMHTSDELNQLIGTVFKELTQLDLALTRCIIMIFDEATSGSMWWMANSETPEAPMNFWVQNHEHKPYRAYKKAWKEQERQFAYTLEGKEKEKWDQFIFGETDLSQLPGAVIKGMKAPERVYLSASFNAFGCLSVASLEPLSEPHVQLLLRFARVFDLTYRRFNDLQKAEAQAREAQIEAALERVRTKAMAMHNTEDIGVTVTTFFNELLGLHPDSSLRCGIGILSKAKHMELWTASVKKNSQTVLHSGTLDMSLHPLLSGVKKAWSNRHKTFSYVLKGEDLKTYFGILNKAPDYPVKFDLNKIPETVHHNSFAFKDGMLFAFTEAPLQDDIRSVLERFSSVFGQTYTRYLDLQKAEAQAREAQIEAALERIRSQVTGMQESSELLDIVVTMRSEFIRLGHEAHYFWHMRWLPDTYQKAMTSGDGTRIGMVMKLPRHIHGEVPLLAKWEKSKEPTVVYAMDADAAVDYVDIMVSLGDFQQVDPQAPSADDIRKIGGLTFVMARTTHGEIGYSLPGVVPNPPAEDINTLVRFAGVFDLAYRRFEDLKESERQKREAEIELALERVRARTMAMQHSDELAEASHLLDKEVRALGIETWGCAFNIFRENDSIEWFGNEAGLLPTYTVPRKGIFKQYYEMGQGGESLFVKEIAGEECVAHYEYMSTLPVVGDVLRQLKETNGAFPTYQIDHVVYFKYGYLLFITREAVPEAHDIFKRFASVFEQTYTRFLDLQKAEAQAKEAVKQASIDRIRGQIASMRTTKDLERITPLIWNELTVLGVPFIRCGVFIVHESDSTVQAFLSAPDGKSLGAMRIPFDADKDTAATVAHWKKGEVYRTHWDKKQFLEFMQTMMHLGQVSNKKEYQGAEEPPESLFLHFLPFKQGMLYVGNTKSLDEDQMEAVGSLADAFSIAYARYEDFVKLEMAKERIERTLGELRETQKQLVHSEKMASLGELTAGIAHEIQNPLNFVNNFSEVSKELIEEMLEEIQKGDVEEAKALAGDIVQNLEKIHHHGQRADGIVKGMLQHSRGSSGEKESTDINVLADEYLRLAYHGLRAKDKSFNATLETHFDESLGKVHVVPQDIGRVILNLITNAFHVVKEKKEKTGGGYTPTVTVTTRRNANGVEISVKDNGNGIPEAIREKIFQPFFTTKPTGQGTGLGLSMSYDIVTKGHGGDLKAISEQGKGSEFIITLPV
ncbi:ATP-binding protein [Muriicola marianensis]|uniref:histidine kinase n=1 Tax=Muriicola marianensis TaxID=1324801 RepID=A0ABQ1QXC6_9FLAO|nr:ATP-binding protein [Muriicola marianensis]GGD48172.1 hypothetical protein GCM10011361_13700 [Muriicola marianensis]